MSDIESYLSRFASAPSMHPEGLTKQLSPVHSKAPPPFATPSMNAVRRISTRTSDGVLSARRVVQSIRDPTQPIKLEMQSVGSGIGALVQIQVPASTPVYARRNALSGILGAQFSSVIARLHVLSRPFARIMAKQPLLAQRILSTEPSTLLIGSQRPAVLTPLVLDGTRDWVVCPNSSVDAYTGSALSVKPYTSWGIGTQAPFAHLMLRGRGQAVVSSPTPVTAFELESGESMLVQKQFLAAYSVDPNHQKQAHNVNLDYQFKPLEPVEHTKVVTTHLVDNTTWRKIWTKTVQVATSIAGGVKKVGAAISDVTRRGNNQFVEVYGPSTVLVSSSAKYEKGSGSIGAAKR